MLTNSTLDSINDSTRYDRQTQLDKIGVAGQQKLQQAHVLIVGVGGLGSPVSLFLAGAGVGKLTLIDHDYVSLSNLHRQILFRESHLEQNKAEAAQRTLADLNSDININVITQRLDAQNVTTLIKQADVVVDAADTFVVSYLLSDACYAQRIPLVSASVVDTHGYLGVFCGTPNNPAPSLRAVFPKPPATGNDCNSVGVTGPSVGVIGSLQAQEVLKVILGDPSQLLGKLMYLDLWDYRQQIIDFTQATEPQDGQIDIIDLSQLTEDDCLIDVRKPSELTTSPLPIAAQQHIPVSELHKKLSTLPNKKRLVCVCQSGQRALAACQQLLEAGHTHIAVMTVDFSNSGHR